jgi:hypothetical protein
MRKLFAPMRPLLRFARPLLAGLALLLPLAVISESRTPDAEAATLDVPPPSPMVVLLMGVVQGKPVGTPLAGRLGGVGLDSALSNACKEITGKGPVALDATTRLDGCHNDTGRKVTFQLNLVNFDATREGTASFMQNAHAALVRGICRNPDVPSLGRAGVTLVFHYAGINGVPVGDLAIAPGNCGLK